MPKPKSSTRPTRAEKSFKRLQKEFDAGTLSRTQLNLIPYEKREIYLRRKLAEKFGKPVDFKCETCAQVVVYDINGSVTDEELYEAVSSKDSCRR